MAPSAMNRSEWLALLLAAAAIITQSFVPPIVGLANNGDFAKITGQFDVGNPSDARDVVRFATTKYVVDPDHYESRFYSSELLLFVAALGLNSVFGRPEVIDLRLMGVVHALVLLLAFYLFLPLVRGFRPALRFALVFLVLVVFMDVMYVSYLNSFYMDTAALLFLLLSVVSFLRALLWHRSIDRWLFVVSAVLLITSKTQHYPLGIPIALMLAWKGGVLVPGPSKVFRILAVTGVLAATVFSCLRGAPPNYPAAGAYTVIFFELLPKSKNQTTDLKELGLDDSYGRYIGTNAYSSNAGLRDPQFEEAFVQQHLYNRIARFFVMHPSTALNVMVSRMDGAGQQRPYVGISIPERGSSGAHPELDICLLERFQDSSFRAPWRTLPVLFSIPCSGRQRIHDRA